MSKKFLKFFVAAGLAVLFLTATTSCHRGYGCPNQIEASVVD